MEQYTNYSYNYPQQLSKYNQDCSPKSINLNSDLVTKNSIAGMISESTKEKGKIKEAVYIGAGGATCFVGSKLLNKFINLPNIYEYIDKIDKSKLVTNSFSQKLGEFFHNLRQKLAQNQIFQKLAQGTRTKSGLVPASARELLSQDLIEKLPAKAIEKFKFEEIVKSMKDGTAKPNIISSTVNKVLENINEILKMPGAKSKKLEILRRKLELLNHADKKASVLSRFLIKTGIGTERFLGDFSFNPFGLLNFLMNGWAIGISIKNTVEAPKGEKFSTLMENILGTWIGGWVMMRYIARGVNAVANLKNLNGISFGQKILRNIGKFIGMGLNSKKTTLKEAWASQGGKLGNLAKWFGGQLKGKGGGTLRLVLAWFILTPIVSSIFKKISHKLFGKPSHSEKENKKQKPELVNKAEPMAQNQTIYDILNRKNAGQNQFANNNQQNQQSTKTYTYIPSPAPIDYRSEMAPILDKILTSSDNAINEAKKILS
ncbi:MAG: hypothetical protein V2B14_05775 [bacterium]